MEKRQRHTRVIRYKYKTLLSALLAWIACSLPCTAGNTPPDQAENDTLKVVDVEEIVIIATPKENQKLRQQPASVSLLSRQEMDQEGISSIKRLTAIVPNLYIPDYGSRQTTAVYLRGIGSRINTPSVGLYVDNIPYIEKAAFDFDYSDIERIDILRGPQSTLYGRNAMGGVIKVHTKSPFSYQGTDLKVTAATHHDYHAALTHYHRLSEQFAFSAGGFYKYLGGFFRNTALDNSRSGGEQAAGGRLHGIVLPAAGNWKIDLNLNYEYSDQTGYPYFYMGSAQKEPADELKAYEGQIAHNWQDNYVRNLLNGGINIEHRTEYFTLSAVTGYQFLKDRMFLDQDFTPQDIYTLEQRQRGHTLSQEVVLKGSNRHNGNDEGRWQWIVGASGFYQQLHTDAPVIFRTEGMAMLGQMIGSFIPTQIDVPMGGGTGMGGGAGSGMVMRILPSLRISDTPMEVGALFDTRILNGALFHQSTIRRLFGLDNLSFTAGIRLEWERQTLDYNSACQLDYMLGVKGELMAGGQVIRPIDMMPEETLCAEATYLGTLHQTHIGLLPRLSLQYTLPNRQGDLYATVSKGYRSGGYNTQMFSDLLQSALRGRMQGQAKETLTERVPDAYRDLVTGYLPDGTPAPSAQAAAYRPEQAWNYEVGTHLRLWQGRLQADAALFWLQTRNQQISRFAANGLGRETVNAGRSRSIGMELAANAVLTGNLTLGMGYGLTHATFLKYETTVDYAGKRVPFVPRHTLNLNATYNFRLPSSAWLDALRLHLRYTGAGSICWTEENDLRQPFYGTLNALLSLHKGRGQIDFWINNLSGTSYTTFCFESMGNRFQQKGRPMQAGISVAWSIKDREKK